MQFQFQGGQQLEEGLDPGFVRLIFEAGDGGLFDADLLRCLLLGCFLIDTGVLDGLGQ